jgi:signal transduction histidine kinase
VALPPWLFVIKWDLPSDQSSSKKPVNPPKFTLQHSIQPSYSSASKGRFAQIQNVDCRPIPSKKVRTVAYCRITEKISDTLFPSFCRYSPLHRNVDSLIPQPELCAFQGSSKSFGTLFSYGYVDLGKTPQNYCFQSSCASAALDEWLHAYPSGKLLTTLMLNAIKLRLLLLGITIGVLGVLIGWAAYTSWNEVANLQEHFNTRHLRGFEIADHIQSTVLLLNNSIIAYELKKEPSQLKEFFNTSSALNAWIDQQHQHLVSPRERELLDRIDLAYDGFLATATNNISSARPEKGEEVLKTMSDVVKASLVMLDLGYQLEDAHRQSLEAILLQSQKSVSRLQTVIFLSLFLLLASVIWSSITVYREMITPLQRKLIASDAIIERQEKLASLGMLAAGVAHEIRNPLTAIKARLFTLEQNIPSEAPEYEDALVIGKEINRLEKIVKAVLQFARPAEPAFKTVQIEPTIREIQQLLRPELEKKGVGLAIGEIDSTPINADPEQLKQVLINLVQNASESINGGGSIRIQTRKGHDVIRGQYRKTLSIQIQDTGKGISPEVEKRLFDPFFSTKEGGTGLGLAIAARIVEKHSGELQYRSEQNHGTTFSIVLPAAA